jgi:transcriptional regulator with XRE-family HTH domain
MENTVPLTFRVRELREAKGWSQAELARRAGLRPATLSAIETNQTTGIDLTTLDALAMALGVEAGFLIVSQAHSARTKG